MQDSYWALKREMKNYTLGQIELIIDFQIIAFNSQRFRTPIFKYFLLNHLPQQLPPLQSQFLLLFLHLQESAHFLLFHKPCNSNLLLLM